MKRKIIILAITLSVLIGCFTWLSFGESPIAGNLKGEVSHLNSSASLDALMKEATSFIVVKHAPLGGSHYAYTEGLAEESTGVSPEGTESNFRPGSSMILMTLEKDGDKVKQTQYTLLESRSGCIRDPDVSEDGKKVVFSWKKGNTDDFHLYEMVIATQEVTQLTFGSGVADFEPQYCANGDIIFSSSRAIQTVDCWKTPVSNIYKCSSDGSNIVRLGYDQVHTTYPVTLSDGRVIYTRWDYNDRTQMYVQGIFQMNPDGTNQTELYGNNSNFPTTLVHTREIPGLSDQYVTIATGHHTYQAGKLAIIDLSDGRNDKDAVTFVKPDQSTVKDDNIDGYGQSGPLYQYPYALNEDLILVSYSSKGWSSDRSKTPFGIYLLDSSGTGVKFTELISGSDGACANIIPVKERTIFERPSMVNYAMDTGTYYVANVYEGEGMTKVKAGSVTHIRVVALDYRAYAIGATVSAGSGSADPFTPIATGNGAWDVKVVLGLATVYEDGSAMFKVPSEMPVYFQLLDKNGSVVQTMRSWSTLMPNEIYSCVGCHEDNNTAPVASYGTTLALKAGVEDLKGDVWQKNDDYDPYKNAVGFSYLEEIQPIFDNKCISCHNNKDLAYTATNASSMNNSGINSNVSGKKETFINLQENWQYLISSSNNAPSGWNKASFNASSWKTGKAGFGDRGGDGAKIGTTWTGSDNYLFIRKTFNITDLSKYANASIILNTWYDDTVRFYLNGNLIYSNDSWTNEYTELNLGKNYTKYLVEGENVFAISVNQHTGGRFIDSSFTLLIPDSNTNADAPISLEGDNLYSSRMKKYFPLSYLVLTGSKPQSGVQWVGTPSNKYINWLSSMSVPEVVTATTYGSVKSPLITRLRNGHGNLTEDEIRTIAAWIDLCVPCYGTYDENNAWSNNDKKEAEEEQNKRDYYDMLNEYARMSLAGTLPKGEIKVTLEYGVKKQEASGKGIVILNTGRKYSTTDKITIVLPEGQKYVGLTLSSRMGEAILYCPDGTFTFKFSSSYMQKLYPGVVLNATMPVYMDNVIVARIPTEEELAEKRNIAENVYDIQNAKGLYPHASSDSEYENFKGDVDFLARNAIDGFTANKGHGSYPVQSWGPANTNNHYIKIDFGREVTVEEIGIIIRYDMPHDTYFKSGTIELSDGTNVKFTLKSVGDEQIIVLEKPIKTTYVKIKNLVAEKSGGWAAFSEVKVYGYDK